jgi:hypothetical protein
MGVRDFLGITERNKHMNRKQTIGHLFLTIGTEGIDVLIREGLRRGMSSVAIMNHLNVPTNTIENFFRRHETEFPLKPGDRVRALVNFMGWRGNGTVIAEQDCDGLIRLKKDGAPEKMGCIVSALRQEIELTDTPELLPDGAAFNDCGYLEIPCDLSETGQHLEFYCPHCKATHRHGLPGGYVIAQCRKADSPLLARDSIFLLTRH